MEWFVKAFLKASLAWLGLGVSLGVLMALNPNLVIYRPAHLHMNLAGFVAMMIFGVGYHVLPRVAGHPLHNPKLAGIHWWTANVGLTLFVSGFIAMPHVGQPARFGVALGGTMVAIGAYLFIYNIWRSLDGRDVARRATERFAEAPASRKLAVREGVVR